MTHTELRSFDVVGIFTRTTNADEMAGAARLAEVWGRFVSQDLGSKIPGRVDNNLLGVYFDYESDANGAYSFILGARVVPGAIAPDGFKKISVPSQSYVKLSSPVGTIPKIVLEAWQTIWNMSDNSKIDRAYTFDFEEYDHRSMNPQEAQMDLFISIKPPSQKP